MTSADDYTAIHEGAVTGAIDDRRQIAVSGPDRASFLQGFLTNDIPSLGAGRGCYAAWLTPQGRMLTDLHVLESGDMVLLDVPAPLVEQTAERLEQFHFAENVQIASLASSLRAVWLHGSRAPQVLATVSGLDVSNWSDYRNGRVEVAGTSVVIARIDQLGVPGFALFVDAREEARVANALVAAGAIPAPSEALEAARIEAGYPIFGVDMTNDTIPLEAGIEDRAISLTKGCYVGQEVIIRVLHRGHGRVARKLVGLSVEGPVPEPHAKIVSGDREIGFVTSAAMSPAKGTIALGYVHRDFVETGTAVDVETGAGRSHAQVTSRSTS